MFNWEEKMKVKCLLAVIPLLLIIIFPSVVSASLNVDVSVGIAELVPLSDQTITATANEWGVGLLIVLQPAEGTSWTDFLDAHPVLKALFYSLPSDIRTEISYKVGDKIVSFKIISFPVGGGSEDFIFPDEFNGINGEPSTEVTGEYNVLFAYLSWEGDVERECCCLVEKEFDCAFGHFNVIPEVPFGTIVASVSMVGALLVYVSMPRLRKKRQNSEV